MFFSKTRSIPPLQDDLYYELLDSGRWCEIAVPTGPDGQVVYFATVWGLSGARSHAYERNQTNELLRKVFLRATAFGDVPYFILGDLNVEPGDSEVLAEVLKMDTGLMWYKLQLDGLPPHLLSDETVRNLL